MNDVDRGWRRAVDDRSAVAGDDNTSELPNMREKGWSLAGYVGFNVRGEYDLIITDGNGPDGYSGTERSLRYGKAMPTHT